MADAVEQSVGEPIAVRWPVKGPVRKNWGDKLNPVLINLLSRRPVVHSAYVWGWGDRPTHLVIGSGLARTNANEVVWGSGLIDKTQTVAEAPARVCAVRGPKTRRQLLLQDIPCPPIFGDPALLIPLLYQPKPPASTFDIGLIQHFREFGVDAPPAFPASLTVRQIDICGGVRAVVDEIVSCRLIISSSLHGLIAAHAYGIPAIWMKKTDLALGDGFKFQDYLASVGHKGAKPWDGGSLDILDRSKTDFLPNEPLVDLRRLIKACPFIDEPRKAVLLRRRAKLVAEGPEHGIFRLTDRAKSIN